MHCTYVLCLWGDASCHVSVSSANFTPPLEKRLEFSWISYSSLGHFYDTFVRVFFVCLLVWSLLFFLLNVLGVVCLVWFVFLACLFCSVFCLFAS